jgi:hypothetical protein
MFTNPDSIASRVRAVQIIVIALAMGCFSVVAVMFVLRGGKAPDPDTSFLTWFGLAFCIAAVFARFVVPQAIVSAGRRRLLTSSSEERLEQLLQLFQIRTIVATALLEGAVFLMATAYLIEGHLLALILAAAGSLAVAAHFPTAAGVAAWIDQQQDRLRLDRPPQQAC